MLHTIQAVSHRCGLSPHVIRIWERRYGALTPSRTDTNRRMYCDDEIERLTMLRELTESGYRISCVAKLKAPELQELLQKHLAQGSADTFAGNDAEDLERAEQFVAGCIDAAKKYESDRLRRLLIRARMSLGQRGMLHQVICPLIQEVGLGWQEGKLRPGHEHIATAVIREILLTPVPGSTVATNAPEIVVSTPVGEIHELGAMLVVSSARDLGWRVTYLGPNLPIEEIAACVKSRNAAALALSLVYPENCPTITEKIRSLRQMLPEKVAILIGGRAANGYREKLPDLNIHWSDCLHDLDKALMKIRR